MLELLSGLRDAGTGILLISHDLSVVRRIADRIAVMSDGEIVEQGAAGSVLGDPCHPATRELLDAIPGRERRPTRPRSGGQPVASVDGVTRRFRLPGGGELQALEDVWLDVRPGETLGLVGESGSGKTTLARIVLGLETADSGRVTMLGEPWSGIRERERRARRGLLGAVYQDARSSFDPHWRVRRILSDALTRGRSRRAPESELVALLDSVGLDASLLDRGTRGLSGGQAQRLAIARALAPRPQLIVCDEPVSSLDVTTQARVLDLLTELQRTHGIAYLFISHDLRVIRHMSDRVAVLHHGRLVETGSTDDVFTAPRHEVTRRLLAAGNLGGYPLTLRHP